MSSPQTEAPKPAESIPYRVNAEEQSTTDHKLTGREILERAGFVPPEDYRLVRDPSGHEIGLDDEESIHRGEVFLATYRNVTPVS